MKKVIKDSKHGYLRLDPIPSKKEVDEFYAKEFYNANDKYFNNSSLLVQLEQSDFFKSRWEKIYKICKKKFSDKITHKKIFDIGYGFGQSLLFFRDQKGMKVSGIEPSVEGHKYILSKGISSLNIGIDDLQNLELNDRYEIVMLLNVLEHLRDPFKTLSLIKEKLLTHDGLLVLEVPNDFNVFQRVANEEYNLDQWWVVSPNHINYFSPNSLFKLLDKCGYDIFEYHTSFPLELFLLTGDNYINDREVGRKCHEKRVQFEHLMIKHNQEDKLNAFYKALADLELGRSIRVYATPKNV